MATPARDPLSPQEARVMAIVWDKGAATAEEIGQALDGRLANATVRTLHVVASGRAAFVRAAERVAVAAGDLLFVPAGMEHRFEELSADFATWVMFYGPVGGERDNPFVAP
jgi:hypothetical protein